jgi:hypothetical protein
MKKILSVLIALCVAGVAFAAVPQYTAVDGGYVVKLVQTITIADTIDATDTVVIKNDFKPDPGWEYVLVSPAFSGTGSDSVALQLGIECENAAGTRIYTALSDSVTVATGKASLLSFGGRAFGVQYNLRFYTYTGAGTQLIMNGTYQIWKRRPIVATTTLY